MTGPATWGPHYWPWALIAISLIFLPVEIYALATNSANTLSYYAEMELLYRPGIKFFQHNAAWFLSQGMYLTGTFWLFFHIWYHKFW